MLCARTYLHVGCRLSYIPRLQHTLALDYERRWNVLHEKASWLIGLERGLSLLSWLSRASWCRFGPCPCPLGGGRCRRRPLTSLLLTSSNVCLVELNHFISSSVPRQPTVWESETAPQTSLTARPHGKCPSHVSHPAQCESGGTDIFFLLLRPYSKHSVLSQHGAVSRPDPYLAKHHKRLHSVRHAQPHPYPSRTITRQAACCLTCRPTALLALPRPASQARPGPSVDSRPNARVTARRKFNLNCSRIQHPSYS